MSTVVPLLSWLLTDAVLAVLGTLTSVWPVAWGCRCGVLLPRADPPRAGVFLSTVGAGGVAFCGHSEDPSLMSSLSHSLQTETTSDEEGLTEAGRNGTSGCPRAAGRLHTWSLRWLLPSSPRPGAGLWILERVCVALVLSPPHCLIQATFSSFK